MAHKIAIIKTRDIYTGDYGEDFERIVQSITEWEEVTDDEFKTLTFAAPRLGFHILEQPMQVREFVDLTISQYKALAKKEEADAAAEKKRRADAALERKFKKELKDVESKRALLKKLQEELGEQVS